MQSPNVLSFRMFPSFFAVLLVVASAIQFGILRDKFIFEATSCLCVGASLLYMSFVRDFDFPRHFFWLLGALYLFVLSSSLSSMHQQTIMPTLNAVFFSLAMFSVVKASYLGGERVIHLAVSMCALSALVILGLSFSFGYRLYRFSGLFDNPNGMGRYASILLLFFFLYLFFYKKVMSFWLKIFFVAFCVLLLVALLASNSRGALGALMGALVGIGGLFTLKFFLMAYVRLKLKKSFLVGFWGVVMVVGLIVLFVMYFHLHEELVSKFLMVTEANDFSQGRFSMWEMGLKNFNFFGHVDYRYELNLEYDAHNNYIHVILDYGVVPALFFFFFFIALGWYFLCEAAKGKSPLSIIGLAIYIHIAIYWMVETGVAIFSVWLMAILYGASLSLKRNDFLHESFNRS